MEKAYLASFSNVFVLVKKEEDPTLVEDDPTLVVVAVLVAVVVGRWTVSATVVP
jgi:hypothetical protein